MGGLTFDDSISFERIFPPGLDRLTLHPKFILWCLEKDSNIIPRITESEIYDKNKANSLAKAFACLQALWFCLQFVTRMAQKLPVSLLELNTFAHSICALLIYLLWWEKPMDIDEASTLATSQSPRIRSLAAWATVRSQLDFYEVLRPGMKSWQTFQQFCDLQFFDRSAADTQARLRWPLFDRLSSPSSSFQDDILPRPAFCGLDLDREGGRFQYVSYEPIVLYLRQGMRVPGTSFYVRAQSCEVDASLAARLKESARIDNNDPEESQETSPRLGTNSLVMELANWPRDRLKSSKSFYGLLFFSQVLKVSREQTVALLLTGLCYGGLHALAFGAPLRSRAETLCWEISCLTIACYGPVIVLLDLLSTVEFICNPLRVKINSQDLLSGAFIVLNALVVYAGLVLYVLSRVYLVIEIFLSLPYVDTGVYQTPNWSVYFPHIGWPLTEASHGLELLSWARLHTFRSMHQDFQLVVLSNPHFSRLTHFA